MRVQCVALRYWSSERNKNPVFSFRSFHCFAQLWVGLQPDIACAAFATVMCLHGSAVQLFGHPLRLMLTTVRGPWLESRDPIATLCLSPSAPHLGRLALHVCADSLPCTPTLKLRNVERLWPALHRPRAGSFCSRPTLASCRTRLRSSAQPSDALARSLIRDGTHLKCDDVLWPRARTRCHSPVMNSFPSARPAWHAQLPRCVHPKTFYAPPKTLSQCRQRLTTARRRRRPPYVRDLCS